MENPIRWEEGGGEGEIEPIKPGSELSLTMQFQVAEELIYGTCTFSRESIPFRYNNDEEDLEIEISSMFNSGACGNYIFERSFNVTFPAGQVAVDP